MSLLRQRIERFAKAALLAYQERGFWAGTRFVLRCLVRKIGLVLEGQAAQWKIPALRAAIEKSRAANPEDMPHLALAVTGGIGDLLVVARFMRDLGKAAQGIVFDVFVARPAIAAWVFKDVPGFTGAYADSLFNHINSDYDAALRANSFLLVYAEKLRWSQLCKRPAMAEIIFKIIKNRRKFEKYVDKHPYLDNGLAADIVRGGHQRRDYLHHIAGIEYGGDSLTVGISDGALQTNRLKPGRYVTIHNGFDSDFVVTGQRATKCYPHFGRVVEEMRASRPDLLFVQLGTMTSDPVHECDINLIGETGLPEVAGLIKGALLHLDNEGGLVHLASCLGTQAVVVFGPTPSAYFGYPANVNIEPPVCGNCWWTTRSWMDNCPEHYETARCMTEQKPENVAAHALAALSSSRLEQARRPVVSRAPVRIAVPAPSPHALLQ